MGIFRSNTVEKRITDAVASRDKLRARLADTEIGIADARAIAERIAVDGDDSQLDTAEVRTRTLVDRSATLRGALAKVETEIADLERQRDEAADRALRERTASEIELLSREVIESGEALAAAAAKLHSVMIRAQPYAPEAAPLCVFAEMAQVEIPSGSALIGKLLRQHRQAVLDGHAPSTLKPPPQAYAAPTPPQAEPIMASPPTPFVVVDRGGPIAMKVAR